MNRTLSTFALGALAAAVLLGSVSSAKADKLFRDEFIAVYVKADSSDAKDKAFAEACETAKCNICHVGFSKKNRNAYGEALDKLLDRAADKDNKEKIRKALEKVAAMKSDPKDSKSPTFGELLKAGKLPGGDDKDKAAAK